jgi:hypothetical protein
VVSQEPTIAANGQGHIDERTKYFYELRLSNLGSSGLITGRFRGAAQPGFETDPEWWLVRGYSDGSKAFLTYTDDKGNVLGRMNLVKKDKGETWQGYLTGFDLGVNGIIQNPILIGASRYDVEHRLQPDTFLDQKSVRVGL